MVWSLEGGTANADWAGAIQTKGLLVGWDPVTPTMSLEIAHLFDRAGNGSSAVVQPVTFVHLSASQTQTFDTDVLTVEAWGILP